MSRPQYKNLAACLGTARAVQLAGLDMKRRAGQVLRALVAKIAFDHVEHLRNALVEVNRDGRAGRHDEVEHDRPKRVIRVANRQGDASLAREKEAIGLDLRRDNLLIEHGVSCVSFWPQIITLPSPAKRY